MEGRHSHYLYRFFECYERFWQEETVWGRICSINDMEVAIQKIKSMKKCQYGEHTMSVLQAAIKMARMYCKDVGNEANIESISNSSN